MPFKPCVISLALVMLLSHSIFASENSVVGIWQTLDNKTHQPRSLVQLYLKDHKLFGEIIKIYPIAGEEDTPLCKKCQGSLKNAPVLGLQIIGGLRFADGNWQKGKILDPNNGKFYRCEIWLEKGILNVRGYLGFFFKTKQWLRHQSQAQKPKNQNSETTNVSINRLEQSN